MLLTFLAGLVRFAGLADDGISHFDEGVYVLWSAGSGYPFRELFAPPLFPLIVRGASMVFGPNDLVAQAASGLIGTATVPLVWLVARRWYGRVAAAASAPLVAFSGIHVAFSRMALTDVCFSFLFVVAMWLVSEAIDGAFHVKRAPDDKRSRRHVFQNCVWAMAAGVAAGAAMNTKYNGFLVIVIAACALGLYAIIPELRRAVQWLRGVGFVALASATAGLLYAPWFWHVHSSFGYWRLLAHHRGYIAGWAKWPANLATLFVEQRMFIDVAGCAVALGVVAAMALTRRTLLSRSAIAMVLGGAAVGLAIGDSAGWIIGLLVLIWLARNPRPATVLHLVWLVGLFVLTPLYQPYPRLLLPLVAAGWLALAAGFAELAAWGSDRDATPRGLLEIRWAVIGAASVAIVVWGIVQRENEQSRAGSRPSLKVACESLHGTLATDQAVALLVRPPVLVYVAWRPQFALLEPARIDDWLADQSSSETARLLVVDMALLRDNRAARESLHAASDRLHEVIRVSYRPGRSVLMDDFGRDVRLAEAASQRGETYALVLYRVDTDGARDQSVDFDHR